MNSITNYSKKKEGKPKLQLLDPILLEELAALAELGDAKHRDNHWLEGLLWTDVIGAIKRHISAIEKGEDIDPEFGLQHTLHAIRGLFFLHYYIRNPDKYGKNDDRLWGNK